ncbi:MAG: DNA polymerase [Patescibacteria group bacterium]|nr:DNA polymerase [Patescibacteria group bacterium]
MKKLLLIDANSLIHRAFHALPPLTSPKGETVGALYGLTSLIIKILNDHKPNYIVAAFDRPEPSFRKEMFKDYKAHRPKTADELVGQIIKAHELFNNFNIPFFERPGFEADDIIGTLVNKFKNTPELLIEILTGDLDALQLVENKKIVVRTMKKGISETIVYDEEAVKNRYGLEPRQLIDYKGLVGDPSDNIPGVKGIGPKTASKLLNEYKTLENLYNKLEPKNLANKKILDNKEQAFFSKKLATINTQVPLEISFEKIIYKKFNEKSLLTFLENLGFKSLINRLIFEEKPLQNKNSSKKEWEDVVFFENSNDCFKNRELLKDEQLLKVTFDWKRILKDLDQQNIEAINPLFDIKLAAWLIDPDQTDFSIEVLAKTFLGRGCPEPLEKENVLALQKELFKVLDKYLEKYGLKKIFLDFEMPLIRVLVKMENWGIGVNKKLLESLNKTLAEKIETLQKQIFSQSGEKFNLNSPKQISLFLFEKLKIKDLTKKTGSGQRRTDKDVLTELKSRHPIIGLILERRELFKIKSGFVEPLINLVDASGKIHTNYLQTNTSTGRLASEKPNLQNIPQESEWSKNLRSAFEASEGFSFLSFDYSQLELRILAHLSNDKKLKAAFFKNKDIHELTASQVFNIPLDKVTPTTRRIAKTLNFGVIYGMGAKAFSKTSGLKLEEAELFINKYFNDFPEIKTWQERIKAEAQTFGFVKNENGRRRLFFGLAGKNNIRGDEERAAINMPIQSLGADILKKAMIECFLMLEKKNWLEKKARPLLTIHDELLFEISDDILIEAAYSIKNLMENCYKISVPLKIETKSGKNWGSMKAFIL